jgi:hypothetical protein
MVVLFVADHHITHLSYSFDTMGLLRHSLHKHNIKPWVKMGRIWTPPIFRRKDRSCGALVVNLKEICWKEVVCAAATVAGV